MKKIKIFILIMFLTSVQLKAQWNISSDGIPTSYTQRSMISKGNLVFAGNQYQGVYRSTDEGTTWNKAGLNNDSLSHAIVFSMLVKDGLIIAGASNGIYVSSDDGITFIRKVHGYPGGGEIDIYKMTISGNNIVGAITVWYSQSRIDAIFYSSDNGENWLQANLPAQAVAVSSVASDGSINVYAGVYTNTFQTTGLYKSTNYGLNWFPKTFSINADIDNMATKGNNVYASNLFSSFYSTNYGETWLNSSPPCGGIWTYSLINNYIFAGNCQGMYYSTNHSLGWTAVNEGFGTIPDVEASCLSPHYLFAGTSSRGIWRIPLSYFGLTEVSENNIIPKEFSLSQNFPNPFNPVTKISYSIPVSGYVRITVFDNLGRTISEPVNGNVEAGNHLVEFDGSSLSSGVYYYKLNVFNSSSMVFTSVKKMLLTK